MNQNQAEFKAYEKETAAYEGCNKSIINLGYDKIRERQARLEIALLNNRLVAAGHKEIGRSRR